jgi:tetratricopeptide (TPR) repeat protein
MSADKKKLGQECFRTMTEAMNKQNWDYAIRMGLQCVKFEPENLLYRQTLRGVETKKYDNNGSGAKMAGMKLMGPKGRIKKCRMRKDWEGVNYAAEEGLVVNPWDAHLNADMGDACRHLGFIDVAKFGYEKATENDPKNKDFLASLAEIHEEKLDFQVAANVWERLYKLDPMNGEARSRAQQAATKQVIDKGGYEGADDTRGVLAPHEIAKRLDIQKPGQADGPGQSEEADLQRQLRKEPDNKDHYIKIGEFYRRNNRLDESRKMFEQAVDISGGDQNVRELLEDVELDIMRKNVELGKEKLTGDDRAEKLAALKRELLLRETEVLRGRVDRHKSDLRIKFQLAQCYMKDGKSALAIPLFQQASQDNRIETRALAHLGQCFMNEKKFPLARRQFEKAAPKINQHENRDLYLDVYYRLGRLCQAVGDSESAESHYSEVLAVDYDYKDALKRLEEIQGG